MPQERTRVATIGAGPSGLLLAWALRQSGVDSIVVENRSRDDVLGRVRAGDDTRLAGYGAAALGNQWRVQQFSQWMTELLHRDPTDRSADFNYRSQLGRLDYVAPSVHAQRALAEQ